MALMLGLLAVPGFVVAPTLFSVAVSRSLAGHLAGEIFHVSNLAVLVLSLLLAGFFWKSRVTGFIWCLVAVVIITVAVNEFYIARLIAELKFKMGPIDLVPADDPLHKSFSFWHGISATLHLAGTFAAAILVAIGPADREKSCSPS